MNRFVFPIKKEVQLSEKIKHILTDSSSDFNDVEVIDGESLDFQEEYKDHSAKIIEDEVRHHIPDPPEAPTDHCTVDDEQVNFEYKQRAVEYWRSSKKKTNLKLETVQHRFKKVKSISQLRRWAHAVNKGGTYREKIARICQYTLDNFKAALDAGFIIHDRDIRRWALQVRKEIGLEDILSKRGREPSELKLFIRKIQNHKTQLFRHKSIQEVKATLNPRIETTCRKQYFPEPLVQYRQRRR